MTKILVFPQAEAYATGLPATLLAVTVRRTLSDASYQELNPGEFKRRKDKNEIDANIHDLRNSGNCHHRLGAC
jgi:hypothetical protein